MLAVNASDTVFTARGFRRFVLAVWNSLQDSIRDSAIPFIFQGAMLHKDVMMSYYCIQIVHEMLAIVHTECVAQGVCETNMSEQSMHNNNESCNLFNQSN